MGSYTVYEPIPIIISSSFESKSNMTTDEAILIKDWIVYEAMQKANRFNTNSEIIQAPKREAERMKKEMVDNIDPTKVWMFIIICVLLAAIIYDKLMR